MADATYVLTLSLTPTLIGGEGEEAMSLISGLRNTPMGGDPIRTLTLTLTLTITGFAMGGIGELGGWLGLGNPYLALRGQH